MVFENLIYKKENRIGILSINRPKALNALNSNLLAQINRAVDMIYDDNEVDVLVITGEGKAFIAGADISEMKNMTPDEARDFSKLGNALFRKLELMEKPVIAGVNGFALGGGCELAMACDIRIASGKAKLGLPEVSLGITPGFGGTQRLSRLVGMAKAKELVFTGKMINAQEAEKIGLVNEVADQGKLMDRVMEMAAQISALSRTAIKYAKSAINKGCETDIETGLDIEKDLFALCFAAFDQKEGMAAFLEKRKPKFNK